MLQQVDVGERALRDYRGVASDAILDDVVAQAEQLRGARVLHLNATPYGGGVAELLRSVVPLLNDLGVVAEWKVIGGDEAFFQVTKAIHNALQGARRDLTAEEQHTYITHAQENAARLTEDYDFIFIHDPQPAALLAFHGKGNASWIWRCHIDTSQPNPAVWQFLRPYLADYDAAVFTMQDFVPPDLPIDHVEIIPPTIDPLSPKNLALPEVTARQILGWIGVQLDRPLITQVARFDPWKDPLGVIAAYQQVRQEVPDAQLALVGSMALDDPEGWDVYHKIQEASAADPLIHVFTNLTGVGNIEVNAFQLLSDVVVQKSLREGFGLVVSEALWKRTPVVAGRAGGIPLQMADGVGGVLVDDIESCARAIVTFLGDPDHAEELAQRGQERVRQHFLIPRLLLNEITLLASLARQRPVAQAAVASGSGIPQRDPVCGMTVSGEPPDVMVTYQEHDYTFCSLDCRNQFLAHPERYAQQWKS
ncbi:MAG TPA: glycosyltransferase [Ktedonobacterales bacterium]|nr:glycosyltransferase [Ktedonobacterales bacterium]